MALDLDQLGAMFARPDDRQEVRALFAAIKSNLPVLEEMLAKTDGEDLIYRFYHQSFKVYRIQSLTEQIVTTLQNLAPQLPLNRTFLEIVGSGTNREFEGNDDWAIKTRPLVEAFFHARYFLTMIYKYGKELDQPPSLLPSGWAAVLELFNIR